MLACVVFRYVAWVLREEKFQKKKVLIPFSLLSTVLRLGLRAGLDSCP